MFNSKLTKIASAVALLSAAGVAQANNLKVTTVATTVAPAATAVDQASLLSESKEVLSAAATQLAQDALLDDGVAATADLLVFEVTDFQVDSGSFIEFTFANGGIDDGQTEYSLVNIADLTALEGQAIASPAFIVDAGDYHTTLRIKTTADMIVGSKWALVDDFDVSGDANLATTAAATTISPAKFWLAEDAATGAELSVTATVLNGTTLSEISGAGDSTGVSIAEVVDGLTIADAGDVTTKAVDFTAEAKQFTDATTDIDTAAGQGVQVTENGTFDIGEAADTYTVTVKATNCAAVDKDDATAVQFGDGTNFVALTYDTDSACTWEGTSAGNVAPISSSVLANANSGVYVNYNSDDTDEEIETATWTLSLSVNDNTAGDIALYTDQEVLSVSGNVQGANAYVPYMYHLSTANWLSFAKLTNNASSDVNVGVTVTVQDFNGNLSGTYTDYFVDTIPAGEMATINARMILDAIGGTTTDTMPTNRGFEDTNFTQFATDDTYNYHMNVTFTFDGTTDANAVDVTVQNKSPNGRAAGDVFYDSTVSGGNSAGRTKK